MLEQERSSGSALFPHRRRVEAKEQRCAHQRKNQDLCAPALHPAPHFPGRVRAPGPAGRGHGGGAEAGGGEALDWRAGGGSPTFHNINYAGVFKASRKTPYSLKLPRARPGSTSNRQYSTPAGTRPAGPLYLPGRTISAVRAGRWRPRFGGEGDN